ncbi:MAG: hypothetical protein FWH11_15320 [Micrococcales bacterium]|nr:hypothetical protein [Micrococcales bacterium]
MIAEVGRALAVVGDGLADLAVLAGVRVVSVDADWQFRGFPVSVVEVSVHVTGGVSDVEALAGWLGLAVEADEVRPGVALSDGPGPSRRWVTWSGWCSDASVEHPVLWRLVASYALDRQAAA